MNDPYRHRLISRYTTWKARLEAAADRTVAPEFMRGAVHVLNEVLCDLLAAPATDGIGSTAGFPGISADMLPPAPPCVDCKGEGRVAHPCGQTMDCAKCATPPEQRPPGCPELTVKVVLDADDALAAINRVAEELGCEGAAPRKAGMNPVMAAPYGTPAANTAKPPEAGTEVMVNTGRLGVARWEPGVLVRWGEPPEYCRVAVKREGPHHTVDYVVPVCDVLLPAKRTGRARVCVLASDLPDKREWMDCEVLGHTTPTSVRVRLLNDATHPYLPHHPREFDVHAKYVVRVEQEPHYEPADEGNGED